MGRILFAVRGSREWEDGQMEQTSENIGEVRNWLSYRS